MRCILEEGFDAASARAITRRAGVTWGVVQYHFGDRDGILAEVVDAGLNQLIATMRAVDPADGSMRERVEALVDAGWRAYTAPLPRAGLEILVCTRTRRSAGLNHRMETLGLEVFRLAREVLPDDQGRAGRVLFLGLRGMALDQLLSADTLDPWRERAALVEGVLLLLQSDGAIRDP